MRTITTLIVAAAMFATPAVAQDNVAAGNTSAADAGTLANTDASLTTEAPANELTAGAGAAPAATDTGMTDALPGEPAERSDDSRFPWGLLGLLGLAGLLGRRRRTEDNDRADR